MGRRAGTNAAPGKTRATRGKNATPHVDFGNHNNFADVVGREFVLAEDDADGDTDGTACLLYTSPSPRD